ncbi:hypothetical protein ARMGADRAFT_1080962 [Armillaria gallica]|uniref:Uncharacterized protein n=1 Tax=Armillaria gallica TaxID=47427 RepID=A0A2H3DAD7_ARMGA|nr:hypothetical protein ARMGADRAFT_1080962 [Armillaria gallica]
MLRTSSKVLDVPDCKRDMALSLSFLNSTAMIVAPVSQVAPSRGNHLRLVCTLKRRNDSRLTAASRNVSATFLLIEISRRQPSAERTLVFVRGTMHLHTPIANTAKFRSGRGNGGWFLKSAWTALTVTTILRRVAHAPPSSWIVPTSRCPESLYSRFSSCLVGIDVGHVCMDAGRVKAARMSKADGTCNARNMRRRSRIRRDAGMEWCSNFSQAGGVRSMETLLPSLLAGHTKALLEDINGSGRWGSQRNREAGSGKIAGSFQVDMNMSEAKVLVILKKHRKFDSTLG